MQTLRKQFDDLLDLFHRYLPNVDPDLIYDLLTRLEESPGTAPAFTLEIFTKKEVDSAKTIDSFAAQLLPFLLYQLEAKRCHNL